MELIHLPVNRCDDFLNFWPGCLIEESEIFLGNVKHMPQVVCLVQFLGLPLLEDVALLLQAGVPASNTGHITVNCTFN